MSDHVKGHFVQPHKEHRLRGLCRFEHTILDTFRTRLNQKYIDIFTYIVELGEVPQQLNVVLAERH